MSTKRAVKIIKEQERNVPEITLKDDSEEDPKGWSTAVGSWVVEFKRQRRVESFPGFDSLFKDALLSGKAVIGTKPSARKKVSRGRRKKRFAYSAIEKESIWPTGN
jgi:hypothetical protein